MIIEAPEKHRIPALRALWQEAFGDTEQFLDAFERTAFAAERCRCVTVDGALAAALYWFDCSCRGARIAYLYAIATAKAYRGRGLCSALMENTHGHLKALGYEGAVLVPGTEELFAFYKRNGYEVCSCVEEFCCPASTDKLELRQVDAEEYAELRRKFLPRGGIIQENENLRFLQTMADLYAGDGFLLAARREGDILNGVELLGASAIAPAAVGTLGCAEGRFRTPGTRKPFAMYRSLGDVRLTPPAYFGLAFD